MHKKVFLFFHLLLPLALTAQSYQDQILDWQNHYKASLLQGVHPLKPADTPYIRFFPADRKYQVAATFVPVTGTRPFLLENRHGGTRKAVREYGYLYMNMDGASVTLTVYRFVNAQNGQDVGGLFIPFTDRTNYKETFPGGRYLDVDIDSLTGNRVVIDFNKSYNPHTAYEKGYPYMMPPGKNSLRIDINAGEKIFGKNPGY